MKKFKKLIALTCVAAMLVPTIAFAADGTDPSGEMNGNGVVENDNAPAIDITNVVLPTTSLATDTYNFTIDAAELLADVDAENYNDTKAEGVWFKAQDAAPELVVTTDEDTSGDTTAEVSLVEKIYVEDTGFAIIGNELAGATDLSAAFTNTYAVWVPEIDTTDADQDGDSTEPTGNGEYKIVTNADITDYFNFVFTSGAGNNEYTSMATKQHTSENDNISNGKLYVLSYVAIDADDAAAKYYDADTTSLKSDPAATLYVVDTDATNDGDVTPSAQAGETTYTTAALAADPDAPTLYELVYKDAVFTNQGTSSKAVVINKSTFDIKVSAKVTVSDATGLTFEADDADLATKTDDASIYMAIKDGTNEIAILGETPTATATLKIAGVDPTNSTLYQTTGPEAITGSHQYYRYLDPVTSYNEAYFEIYAATDAADDWDAYVEAVKEAGAAPKINVVYSWEKAGLVTEISGNTYSRSATNNTYTIDWANAVEVGDRAIKSISLSLNGTDIIGNALPAACYNLAGSTLTIDATQTTAIGAGADGQVRYFIVTFMDNSTAKITVNVTQ